MYLFVILLPLPILYGMICRMITETIIAGSRAVARLVSCRRRPASHKPVDDHPALGGLVISEPVVEEPPPDPAIGHREPIEPEKAHRLQHDRAARHDDVGALRLHAR